MSNKFHKKLKSKLFSIDIKYRKEYTKNNKVNNSKFNNWVKGKSSEVRVYQLSEEELKLYRNNK